MRELRGAEEATEERGEHWRSRTSDGGVEPKANLPGNELGLSGMVHKEDATVDHGGNQPMNDSYSSPGM